MFSLYNPFGLKSVYFYTLFRARERRALLVLLGNVMNNPLSARRQVLIRKSGRTIERLALNSEVVNLKYFSIKLAFIYPFICFKKQKRKIRTTSKAKTS